MSSESKNHEIIMKNLYELKERRALTAKQTVLCLELLARSQKIKGPSDYDMTAENFALPETYEIFSPKKRAVISYVKNNYNDAAFLRFSSLFTSTKVSYGASFEEICENVYNEVSDYCILPIESASDGKLLSFYSLIDKYDLHVVFVCDIDDTGSSRRTRYALLSRKLILIPDTDKKCFFEFSLIKDEDYALSEILEVADAIGASLYRIDSIPVPYDDLTFRIYHVFEADRDALRVLALYLKYKHPQAKMVGHYLLIE